MSTRPSGKKGRALVPYIPPLIIDVYVDVDKRTIDPPQVEIESSDQLIRWSTNALDIDVVFRPPIWGAHYRRGSGTCELSQIPTGNKGKHKYTVIFRRHDGKMGRIDPDVIVKY